jgi:hypothetical protein
MHLTQPDIFTFFRMGLATGLIDREAVITWADHKVLESDIPDPRIMELSLAAGQPYSQLIGLLNLLLEGYVEYDLPLKLLFAQAGRLLMGQPEQAQEIAQGLVLLLAEGYLPRNIKNELHSIEGDLELFGLSLLSYQSMRNRLAGFLGGYAEYNPFLSSLILE